MKDHLRRAKAFVSSTLEKALARETDIKTATTTPPEESTPELSGTIRYWGIPVSRTKDTAYLIDISGSMGWDINGNGVTLLDLAKEQLFDVLGNLAESTKFNVILFDGVIEPWEAAPQLATAKNLGRAQKFVRKHGPRGSTNIYDPLELALRNGGIDELYLLSDGHPNTGAYVHPEDITSAVATLNQKNKVKIHTIALGHDSPLLEKLSSDSNGQHRIVCT